MPIWLVNWVLRWHAYVVGENQLDIKSLCSYHEIRVANQLCHYNEFETGTLKINGCVRDVLA